MGSRPGGRIYLFRIFFIIIIFFFFFFFILFLLSLLLHCELHRSTFIPLMMPSPVVCVFLSVFGNVTAVDVNYSTDEPECVCVCVCSKSHNDVPRVAQRYGTIAAHTRRRASVHVVFVVFCVQMYSFAGLIRRTPPPMFSDTAITERHPDTTIFQLRAHWVRLSWSIGSEKSFGGSRTLDFLRLSPLCQALRTNQRDDSQNLYIVVGLSVAYYANRKIILFK